MRSTIATLTYWLPTFIFGLSPWDKVAIHIGVHLTRMAMDIPMDTILMAMGEFSIETDPMAITIENNLIYCCTNTCSGNGIKFPPGSRYAKWLRPFVV